MAATGAALPGAAQAQSGAPAASSPASQPAAPVSAAKKQLVARLLKVHEPAIENLGRTLVEPQMQQLVLGVRAALVQVPQEQREGVAREIEADIRRFVEDVTPLLRERALALAPQTMGAVFEQRFTEEELRQLLAILEAPVARRYQATLGEMQRALGGRLVAETKGTVQPKLNALEQSVTQRLRAAMPAATPPGAAASR
ncbi:MAG: hypothetical protein JNL85_10625 [Rubrivivax sp.]|nr:hypothetical protein [Rubrivivax sp.]